MLAKMALRSSPERVTSILAAPSSDNSTNDKDENQKDVHPRISDPASNQTVEDAVISMLIESTDDVLEYLRHSNIEYLSKRCKDNNPHLGNGDGQC